MIDIHCHILPAVDDGPEALDEAVKMCQIAAADGITTIVTTPHYKPGTFEHPLDEITRQRSLLTAELEQLGLRLRLIPGADVRVTPELHKQLANRHHLFINANRKYFLAEFYSAVVPPGWDAYLRNFLNAGITPIITHPERNQWFLDHPEALYDYVGAGGMVQITAMSVSGDFGRKEQEYCELLLRHNLVHAIATDAHNARFRPPILSDAVKAAAAVVGEERARDLVTTIPQAIIDGKRPELPAPVPLEKKSWFRRWIGRK